MTKRKIRTLPIRTRRILAGDGEQTLARTVLCPMHGSAVALPVCAECARCERIDNEGVRCTPEMVQPTMRWTPLLRRMLPSAADRVAIAELMSRDVTCARGDVSIEALAELLLDANIGAVPVVDGDGFPIGMLSRSDLLRDQLDSAGTEEVTDEIIDGEHVTARAPKTVRDLMMPIAFTLREDDPLSRAAAVMATERVHHLPIVAADGRVVGMLSSLDFVRWVAAQSGYADQA